MAPRPYQLHDPYFVAAKAQGFRARSAFKLEEMIRQLRVPRQGDAVLDLGAAPGGFLQILARAVGTTGLVVGVDLVPIRPFSEKQLVTAALDATAPNFDDALSTLAGGRQFDVVVSDMAPKTSGIRDADEARSIELATVALEIARRHTKRGATLIVKLFMGAGYEDFRRVVAGNFEQVRTIRPDATRRGSRELYIAGLRRRRETQ